MIETCLICNDVPFSLYKDFLRSFIFLFSVRCYKIIITIITIVTKLLSLYISNVFI